MADKQQNKLNTRKARNVAATRARKAQAKIQALKNAKKAVAGQRKRQRTIRTKPSFFRPKTLRLPRDPKVARKAVDNVGTMDPYSILRYPINSETALKLMETKNTLVFIVDKRANKYQIKQAIERLYDIKPMKVNTLIKPTGEKKAFVRCPPDQDVVEWASKIGLV